VWLVFLCVRVVVSFDANLVGCLPSFAESITRIDDAEKYCVIFLIQCEDVVAMAS
jgi:hypothetical protein